MPNNRDETVNTYATLAAVFRLFQCRFPYKSGWGTVNFVMKNKLDSWLNCMQVISWGDFILYSDFAWVITGLTSEVLSK
jgi:hypothetical protein